VFLVLHCSPQVAEELAESVDIFWAAPMLGLSLNAKLHSTIPLDSKYTPTQLRDWEYLTQLHRLLAALAAPTVQRILTEGQQIRDEIATQQAQVRAVVAYW
jgi:hypothetical protein